MNARSTCPAGRASWPDRRAAEDRLVRAVYRDQRAGEPGGRRAGQQEPRPARGIRRPDDGNDCGAKNSASLAGETRLTGSAAPVSAAGIAGGLPRLLRQSERPLADDVALDLAGARVDRASPAAQEDVLPLRSRVVLAVRPDQPVGACRCRSRPRRATCGTRSRPASRSRPRGRAACLRRPGREGAQAVEPHDLHARVRLSQVLAYQRVGVACRACARSRPAPRILARTRDAGR